MLITKSYAVRSIIQDLTGPSRLINEHFPRLQSKELKYRALSRRPRNRPHLLALLRDLLQNYKCVTHVLDKRFLLILMFCDYAVEPWYYKHGVNFYADGQNYAMGSLLSAVGPKMLGAEPYSRPCWQLFSVR